MTAETITEEIPAAADIPAQEEASKCAAFIKDMKQAVEDGSTRGYYEKSFGLDADAAVAFKAQLKPVLEPRGYRVITACSHYDDFGFEYVVTAYWSEEAYTRRTTPPKNGLMDGVLAMWDFIKCFFARKPKGGGGSMW